MIWILLSIMYFLTSLILGLGSDLGNITELVLLPIFSVSSYYPFLYVAYLGHDKPEDALCDREQAITIEQLSKICFKTKKIKQTLNEFK